MHIANHSGTKCPKCEKSNFELVEDFPTHSNFKHYYMRCSFCKTFLAAFPFLETNVLVDNLHNDVKKIKSKLLIS